METEDSPTEGNAVGQVHQGALLHTRSLTPSFLTWCFLIPITGFLGYGFLGNWLHGNKQQGREGSGGEMLRKTGWGDMVLVSLPARRKGQLSSEERSTETLQGKVKVRCDNISKFFSYWGATCLVTFGEIVPTFVVMVTVLPLLYSAAGSLVISVASYNGTC